MADPGFPAGGAWTSDAGAFHQKCMYAKTKEFGPVGVCGPIGGHGPPMQVLFTENVCKNERSVCSSKD